VSAFERRRLQRLYFYSECTGLHAADLPAHYDTEAPLPVSLASTAHRGSRDAPASPKGPSSSARRRITLGRETVVLMARVP
jgi:hypothetical protein